MKGNPIDSCESNIFDKSNESRWIKRHIDRGMAGRPAIDGYGSMNLLTSVLILRICSKSDSTYKNKRNWCFLRISAFTITTKN